MKRVIDTFSFFNELDMLHVRLEYLYDIVDKFVLIESTLDYAGFPKKLYYKENKELYNKYNDKIIHVIIDDFPDFNQEKNAWVREREQRNRWIKGINDLNDNDVIIINDVDEIPDKDTLARIKFIENLSNNIYSLEQDMYYYNINCKLQDKWYHSKIVNFWTFKNVYHQNASYIRTLHLSNKFPIIKNGGWHFSYFGNIDFIKNKIKCFAHQEYNNDTYLNDEKITEQIKNCKDIFFRDDVKIDYIDIKDNKYLPDNYEKLMDIGKNV